MLIICVIRYSIQLNIIQESWIIPYRKCKYYCIVLLTAVIAI